jgi:hypothetical protein
MHNTLCISCRSCTEKVFAVLTTILIAPGKERELYLPQNKNIAMYLNLIVIRKHYDYLPLIQSSL